MVIVRFNVQHIINLNAKAYGIAFEKASIGWIAGKGFKRVIDAYCMVAQQEPKHTHVLFLIPFSGPGLKQQARVGIGTEKRKRF